LSKIKQKKGGEAILKELVDQGNSLGRTPIMEAICSAQDDEDEEDEGEEDDQDEDADVQDIGKAKLKGSGAPSDCPQVYIQFLGLFFHRKKILLFFYNLLKKVT
jgi:hypothetical protein